MHRMLHVLAVAGLLAGCGEPAPAPDTEEQLRVQEREELDRFFATAWEERLALSPELRARMGQRIDYGSWDDRSAAGLDREYFLLQGQWDTLQKTVDYVRLDPQRRLSYDLFIDEVQRLGERYRWRHHDYLLDQQGGVHRDVPTFLIHTHAIRDEADALAYISRLHGVPALFAQIEERLAASEQAGVLPPKFVYGHVIQEARNVLRGRPYEARGEDNVLLRDFTAKLAATSIPRQRRTELTELASAALLESVRPAYASLIRVLEDQNTRATADEGVWRLPNGAQYYRSQLRWHTTTDLTPDEIHELGLREVARVHGELRAFMASQGFRGTLRELPRYELEVLADPEPPARPDSQPALTLAHDLPEFRKSYVAPAYTEGWKLYAASLDPEPGGPPDTTAHLRRLVRELTRAVQLVVDTGLHARRWTRDQAIDYHFDNTPLARSAATRAVERYIVEPGAACAYLIGMLRIVELRERARTALGERFSLRDFHDAVLNSGPVPLTTLERIVNGWIEEQRCNAASC